MWPLAFGNPDAASVMQAMLLVVWLRPVSRHERVGEHSAVVWKFVYLRPRSAMRVDVRRLDQTAVRLHRREPNVVEDDIQDVRRAVRRHRLGVRLPVRGRVLDVDVDLAVEHLAHFVTIGPAAGTRHHPQRTRTEGWRALSVGHSPTSGDVRGAPAAHLDVGCPTAWQLRQCPQRQRRLEAARDLQPRSTTLGPSSRRRRTCGLRGRGCSRRRATEEGRLARKRVPRSSHADFDPTTRSRPDRDPGATGG